jgi:flagellar motor switch protein FliM
MASRRVRAQQVADGRHGAVGETAPTAAGASGGPTRSIKNYDFRRPDKFSREHIRSLQVLSENFARLLAAGLTSALRVTAAIRVTAVEQIAYREFSERLPKPAILYLMSLDPLPGRAVFALDLPVGFALLDRLLGGPGDATGMRSTRRGGELSEIEVALLRGVADSFAAALREAWLDLITLQPAVEDVAFNAELAQAALPNEVCVLLDLEIKLVNSTGTLSLCLPHTLLEPIIGHLSAPALVAGPSRADRRETLAARRHTLRRLEQVMLPVVVQLGAAQVSVRDVLALEPGDVIRLDTGAESTLPLLIDGRLCYWVRPGTRGPHLAVRIEGVVPPEIETLPQPAPARPDREGTAHEEKKGKHEHDAIA